ncbi:cellulose binding domain-containing protein [Micromonospora sp. WMMD1102]|uniref:cellulose binding domain-containing protein n=1 Tax=Micromonospora sp. WMMD1102 TaxID=3016105 RepID=UPI0024151B3D|nr:cellulose binding domain-containing protein [Micromonospora sp. WMMD1102]MDG4785150.1 cellulose binding domain-containing protein [Micromonospora sp. WMMD1102]
MTARIRSAVIFVLVVFTVAIGAAPAHAASSTASADPSLCDVTTTTNAWAGGFTVSVTIENTSDVTITWRATLTLTNGTLSTAWGVTTSYANGRHTIVPERYGEFIAPRQSYRWGYNGTGHPAIPEVVCTRALP